MIEWMRAAGLAGALALAALAAPMASAADAEAGRALYETRCGGCHDRSVHERTARAAKSFAQLRAAIARWDRHAGALWRKEEIDAVTRYLNDRYYRFPCPDDVCGSARG